MVLAAGSFGIGPDGSAVFHMGLHPYPSGDGQFRDVHRHPFPCAARMASLGRGSISFLLDWRRPDCARERDVA